MPSFFSSDGSSALQFAVIFLVIFLVLAVLVLAFRRLTGRGPSLSAKTTPRGRQPRLGIVDIYELDRQRQLILLRRDNVEHLLLVGGPNDVVVERNITRGAAARMPADAVPDIGEEPPQSGAPEVDPPRTRGEASAPPFAKPAVQGPGFTMPAVVETPLPGSFAPPPRVGSPIEPAPSPGPPAPEIDPPRRPGEPQRATRRVPPPLANLVPDAAAERSRLPDPKPSMVQDPAPRPIEPPFVPALPAQVPVLPPGASRPIDAAILSDMARQLEEALRRPASAVTAPPAPAATPDPVQAPIVSREPEVPVEPEPAVEILPEPSSAPDPIVAAAPSPEPVIEEPEEIVAPVDAVREAERPVDPIAAAMATAQAPPMSDGLFDEPQAPHEPAPIETVAEPFLPEPPAAEPAKGPPPKPSSQNPFSVEEIEAEFARLLGRPLDRK